jgi:predicted  nucleic acid-binding Zn-ribbon protein
VKAELQKLIALQNLDTSIRKLETDQQAIPERRAEIEREFDQRAFEIRALESRRDEAKHTRARLETEVADQRSRAERAERNLMSSKKQEEYTAAIREADAARKQISALETQILEQMEQLEQAEAALNERAAEIASLNSDREARLKAFDEETWNDWRPARGSSQRARGSVCQPAETDERNVRQNQSANTRRRCGCRGAQSILLGVLHVAAAAGDGRDSSW